MPSQLVHAQDEWLEEAKWGAFGQTLYEAGQAVRDCGLQWTAGLS